jgi:integrase
VPGPAPWLCSPSAAPTSEGFARDLEARGRARATVTRRLCTIAGFYRYAVEEEFLDHSRPPMSAARGSTTSLTPSRWTATNSARRRARVAEHALISLLALNGLRVSEATGATSSIWAWACAGTGR